MKPEGEYNEYISDQYPDVTLRLFGYSISDNKFQLDKNGVWGYHLSVENTAEDAELPDLVLRNGITWGTGEQNMIDAYGEPEERYMVADTYEHGYLYHIGEEFLLRFSFDAGNRQGLTGVHCVFNEMINRD